MFSNLSLGSLGKGIVSWLLVLQHLLLPKAPWFSEFSISIATWCSYNYTPEKSWCFEIALLHSPFNSFHSRQAVVTSVSTNPFFPTINGFLDSIIPMRIYLKLLNMKLQMFSFINYPVLPHLLLKMPVEICNPKSSNLLHCDIQYDLCVCTGASLHGMTDTGKCDTSFLGLNCSQLSWPFWQPIWTACNFSTPLMASTLLGGVGSVSTPQSSAPLVKGILKCDLLGSGLA